MIKRFALFLIALFGIGLSVSIHPSNEFVSVSKETIVFRLEEDEAVKEADEYATYFLSLTQPICENDASANHLSSLKEVWPELTSAYALLSEDAKDVFNIGKANDNIKHAHDLYTHIMSRYSTYLAPFDGGPSFEVQDLISNSKSDKIIAMIVFISIFAVTSIVIVVISEKKLNN